MSTTLFTREETEPFLRQGWQWLQLAHSSRPGLAGSVSVAIELVQADDIQVYTSVAGDFATLHFSRGWIVCVYESLLRAAMSEDWPDLLSTVDAKRSGREHAKNGVVDRGLVNFLSATELAALAFRFVYLHEFFHAVLGHTRFLTRHFVEKPSAGKRGNPSPDEVEELRKARVAFELEADACAFKTLLSEIFRRDCDDIFESRGTTVLAAGFVLELMYLMNLDAAGQLRDADHIALFRFEDDGAYAVPLKRRWFLLCKLFESCENAAIACAFEQCLEYGASVARSTYCLLPESAPQTPKRPSNEDRAMQHLLALGQLMRTGQAMVDPADWVRHQDAVLRRIRAEFVPGETPSPYAIRFVSANRAVPARKESV